MNWLRTLAIWLLLTGTVDAATLYVNNSGSPACSDSTTKASNSAGSPWCSVYRAAHGSAPPGADDTAQAAAAGDVVTVTAGTYATAGTGTRNVPALNPANDGTAGNYITFQCATTHGCILQLSSSDGPVIGAYVRVYIKWIGFYVNELNATPRVDTGPAVCWASVNGCWLESNRLIGYQYGHNRADNHPAIRAEDSGNFTIKGNTISGFYTCPITTTPCSDPVIVNLHNGTGVQLYRSTGGLIENNDISDSGSCIFLKGGPWTTPQPGTTVRFNLCHDLTLSGGSAYVIHAGSPATLGNPTLIHQNIAYSIVGTCMRLWWFGGADDTNDPRNSHFINNTCDQTDYCIEFVGTPFATNTTGMANSFWNNICSRQTNGIRSEGTTIHQDATEVDHEHNVFFSTSGTNVVLNGGSTNLTYAQWQASPYTQDATAPALSTSDPTFTNTATRTYTLQGGSPAATQGRVTQSIGGTNGSTIPAGAYITGSETIGVSGGGGGSGRAPRVRRFRPGD